jgi:hypothetical protein
VRASSTLQDDCWRSQMIQSKRFALIPISPAARTMPPIASRSDALEGPRFRFERSHLTEYGYANVEPDAPTRLTLNSGGA